MGTQRENVKHLLAASLPPPKHLLLNSKALSETHKPFFQFCFSEESAKKKKILVHLKAD